MKKMNEKIYLVPKEHVLEKINFWKIKMKNENYAPISCGLYDQLEALCTMGIAISISYIDQNDHQINDTVILKDLQTKNKEEFVVFKDGTTIRLDNIIELNGQLFRESSC